jgi:hypothetical protein
MRDRAMQPGALSDAELLSALLATLGSRRRLTAKLIFYLGELAARRLELKAGYSSLFDFCCRRLGMSEGEACRHITAARVARRFPLALELLREGRLHLTGLEQLAKYLTPQNHSELFAAAAGKSKAEIDALLRAHFPRPDVPARVRKLPAPHLAAEPAVEQTSGNAERRSRLEPLSAQRYLVQFTANATLRDKLERALNLTSHDNPHRELAVVVERGLDLLLARLEKQKLGKSAQPRRRAARKAEVVSGPVKAGTVSGSVKPRVVSRAVRRAVRRAVFERDGECCSFVSETGERCPARTFLELDHRAPRALGGRGDSDNVRVLCRAHNRLAAEQVFGKEYIDSRIHLRQRGYVSNAGTPAEEHAPAQTEPAQPPPHTPPAPHTQPPPHTPPSHTLPASHTPPPLETRTKLLAALTHMGFRRSDARRAVAELRHLAYGVPLETELREALLLLTPT